MFTFAVTKIHVQKQVIFFLVKMKKKSYIKNKKATKPTPTP